MGIFLNNRRPTSSLEWGVGNSDFANRFIELEPLKKQTGYLDGEAPTAVGFNWILNNIHRWLKNLDERTAKVPVHSWTVSNAVNRLTDRDFTTLAEALASSSVGYGDTIYVASQESLTASITISKSVKIVFANESYIYGDSFDDSIKIILNAPEIQIVGGKFYAFGGNTFHLTAAAESCSIEGCFFNTADPIDDSLVQPGYVPSIRGCKNYVF